MNPVYILDNKNELKYFIFGINETNDEIDSEEYRFEGIKIIKNNAFQNPRNVKRLVFDKNLKTIEKEAFKDCSDLEVFCCGEYYDQPQEQIVNLKVNELVKKQDVTISSSQSDETKTKSDTESKEDIKNPKDSFTIQAFAFAGCEKLHTVVFPECSKLTVEKSAFSGCESLRTVIALCDEISFTENPFEDCPKELVFVCTKDSATERFARENGYRVVNVQ